MRADERLSEKRGQTRPEQRNREAADDLIGPQRNREKCVHECQRQRGKRGGKKCENDVVGLDVDDIAEERTHQHHPLDAKVLDSGSLRERFAQGRQQDRRAGGDCRQTDGDEEVAGHVLETRRR